MPSYRIHDRQDDGCVECWITVLHGDFLPPWRRNKPFLCTTMCWAMCKLAMLVSAIYGAKPLDCSMLQSHNPRMNPGWAWAGVPTVVARRMMQGSGLVGRLVGSAAEAAAAAADGASLVILADVRTLAELLFGQVWAVAAPVAKVRRLLPSS